MTENRISQLKSNVGKFLALGFVLVFLFAQSTSLLHTHAGDLKRHVDCELCLKVGSGDDALISTHLIVEVPAAAKAAALPVVLATNSQAIAPKSRSPPSWI